MPLRAECRLWWANTTAGGHRLDSLLTAEEEGLRAGLAHEDDRRRFTVARALARAVIGLSLQRAPADIRFSVRCKHCGGAHGKPELPGTRLSVSWSHSGEWVACAVARAVEVGVDVEAIPAAGMARGLEGTVLSPGEARALGRLPEHERRAGLLTYWTRKEAALKATADGLSVPLPALTVSAPYEPARVTAWTESPPRGRVRLHDVQPGPGYVGCLALLSDRPVRVVESSGEPLLATATRYPQRLSAG